MPRPPFAVLAFLAVCAIAGLVAILALFKYAPPRPRTAAAPPSMRLPRSLVPHSYRLVLKLHLLTRGDANDTAANETLNFSGASVVDFRCVEATGAIFLHSKGLWLSGAPEVTDQRSGVAVKVSQTVLHNDGSDFLEVGLEEPLESGGDYSLKIHYSGQMSRAPTGLYVSSYQEGEEEDEETR